MQAKFDTESIKHGKAALLLYAMYRSRPAGSSLNGLDTWDRCNNYIRAAALKSSTTAEFVQVFCKKADVQSIKPVYFRTDGLVAVDDFGTLMKADGVYNYQLEIFEDQDIYKILSEESQYIIMLVRERIQREKREASKDEPED